MIEQTNKKQNKILTKTKNKTTKTQESYFWGAPWSDVAPGPLRDKKNCLLRCMIPIFVRTRSILLL